ncbi:hypothetical protein [Leptolyngbya ohadii]|uniref:hypothetical protein n=1 Tax=Leptolyngbya ohadii TaxID=1962290 RepID=UPI000B5A199F|nr:hypothetical protein [Leptolyngbya ohadii]
MTLHLHIDRLILNDFDLTPSQRHLLQSTIESELSRLLTENGASHLQQSQAIASLSIAPINAAPNSTPTQMGQQIAQNIYQGMNYGR